MWRSRPLHRMCVYVSGTGGPSVGLFWTEEPVLQPGSPDRPITGVATLLIPDSDIPPGSFLVLLSSRSSRRRSGTTFTTFTCASPWIWRSRRSLWFTCVIVWRFSLSTSILPLDSVHLGSSLVWEIPASIISLISLTWVLISAVWVGARGMFGPPDSII